MRTSKAVRDAMTMTFFDVAEQVLCVGSRRLCRSMIDRFMKRMRIVAPEWELLPISLITPSACEKIIQEVCDTPAMRDRVRKVFQYIFTQTDSKHLRLPDPASTMNICQNSRMLTLEEIERLLRTALLPTYHLCAPAVGLMLWAGLSLQESCRLRWRDIDFAENRIVFPASPTKPGEQPETFNRSKIQVVHIYPVLQRWLLMVDPLCIPLAPLIAPVGRKTWRRLLQAAGLTSCDESTLLRTYAIYYFQYTGKRAHISGILPSGMSMPHISYSAVSGYWGTLLTKLEMSS